MNFTKPKPYTTSFIFDQDSGSIKTGESTTLTPRGMMVASITYRIGQIEQQKATARLLAAAPGALVECVKAMKLALQELEGLNKGVGWRDDEWPSVTCLRAAIASAEAILNQEEKP